MIIATISCSNAASDFAKQRYSGRHTWSFDGGETIAAVSVSGPIERLSRHPGERFGEAVVAAAGSIEPE